MNAQCAQSRARVGGFAAVVLLVGATVRADVPALVINWSVGGGPVNAALPAGEANGENSFIYQGTLVDVATGLELDFNLKGDPTSALDGNVSIQNELDQAIEVFIEILLPASPPLPDGSLLAGQCVVGLTTNPDGGQISSLPPFLWQALTDGSAVGAPASLFADPFILAHPGATSSGTSSDFGSPEPISGPAIEAGFGFEINFALTAHDRASITSGVVVADAFPCPGDLDGDGEIGIGDVIDLLAMWGACPAPPDPCPGDLDGDGAVGVTDFLGLLALWGPCP